MDAFAASADTRNRLSSSPLDPEHLMLAIVHHAVMP